MTSSLEYKFGIRIKYDKEIELEEVQARRKVEIEVEIKNKGKCVQIEGDAEVTERAIVVSEPTKTPETNILDPCPISSVSGVFDVEVEDDDVDDDDEDDEEDDEEENDDDIMKDHADDVYSASSDHDDDQGSTGIKITEASNEEKIDEYLHDDANEEPENAEGEGEPDDTKNVDESEDHVTRLILRLEHGVEEGEYLHTYNLADIVKMTHVDEINFNFDFEEELNQFDINQQPEYQYKYVEDADIYDRVEVEDCSDEEQSENINVDTSNLLTLAEFFSQANEDELRRKVTESVKNKSFNEMSKEEQREERKKWFNKDTERKFKRLLKFNKRDREVSLGDIISWGYLPQVNAYAVRREFGVQYFTYIQDIMSLPRWDVEELPKVRTLMFPIRERDMPTWGLMKFEAIKDFKHWKRHYPKKVLVHPEYAGMKIDQSQIPISEQMVISRLRSQYIERGSLKASRENFEDAEIQFEFLEEKDRDCLRMLKLKNTSKNSTKTDKD
ncbi:MATH and LRR domain-containing protein PFE0570w-like [Helianthus annuus]|uniref:MATH and LRR domain-containing protein PFE0570w-like n=1 Tax=Helianthus annuus TaxID=4232 RepID=UPI000B8F121A|nr:MATH and LRR domain-containing protein PFE0570w-like [Helianthus annuus]